MYEREQQHDVDIENYLPHRSPMLMVNKIIAISPVHVLCSFLIDEDNIFVNCGTLQEIGLIENMAQTCSAIVGQTFYEEHYNPILDKRIIGFISAIKELSVFNLPQVSETILTDSTLTSKFDSDDFIICTMFVQAKHNQVLLASAEINLFLKKQ
ncbi:hypothetical protein [Sphingobacterium sp. JB170]|uniref:hypothetical protein n=1 Tax=Sphingobacterium sp. JB170 TaxID=1434842 RepID=UPI00097F4F79|nr:hypothetical protein [Sphingobacterium sp. JB170]SJN44378.1 3-hydroxydecanoyl-[ACP] dehydratase [Sphingobacterium sp. JB170]